MRSPTCFPLRELKVDESHRNVKFWTRSEKITVLLLINELVVNSRYQRILICDIEMCSFLYAENQCNQD